MRGAARVGGRAFRPTPSKTPKNDLNPFNLSNWVDDLPVAPALEPINDEWSWSLGADPADPRDCARYPASPYCGELPLAKSPFGFAPEFRTNGCETCFYIYPIILFLKATPQVICKRDPNCDRQPPPLDKSPISKNKPPLYPESVPSGKYKSPACAERERIINVWCNWANTASETRIEEVLDGLSKDPNVKNISMTAEDLGTEIQIADEDLFHIYNDGNGHVARRIKGDSFTKKFIIVQWIEIYNGNEFARSWGNNIFVSWVPANCPNMPIAPPILPPPPVPPFNDRPPQNRKKGKDMCCNDCADSKDNTEKLLREITEIKKALGTGKLEKALDAAVGIGDSSVTAIVNLIAKRLGTSAYPIEVPQSLLHGLGDGLQKLESNAEFLHWLTYQFDSLVGQFPIDIDVKDIDPLKDGDQKKTIQIPNVAEALAEMYALTLKSSVNQEVELNMLLRLAAETIATKNAAVVTQDYARANAQFLGYKANFKPRELLYNFDFANGILDPKSKEPIVLEKLLKTVKGYVQGWEMQDKETVVGFLQKLMFSAGIIKAVFFRGKKQQKELQREITSMANDEKAQEAKFDAFIKEINDPESRFNKDSQDKPIIKDVTPPDSKGAK